VCSSDLYNPVWQGSTGVGSSRQTKTLYQNGTAFTISAATPVSQGTGLNILPVDVTDESSVEKFVGLADIDILSTASGLVVSDGRIENIPAGLGLATGDALWVGITPGSLTNVKPSLGVGGWSEGMFVIFIGVVVQNQFNPFEQDIQIFKQIVGEL
jgi:hypothetical protein